MFILLISVSLQEIWLVLVPWYPLRFYHNQTADLKCMLKDGWDRWCQLCDETCPEVIGTRQTIRTNGKMLQTMVSYKTFPAVSCLLPHPQLFFISGDCHLNFTYMCFNFTVWLKLISILCRNKYPKTPTIANRKQISHNFNSIKGVCTRLGDGRLTELASEKMAHYTEAV